jgi:hypothetical protein
VQGELVESGTTCHTFLKGASFLIMFDYGEKYEDEFTSKRPRLPGCIPCKNL